MTRDRPLLTPAPVRGTTAKPDRAAGNSLLSTLASSEIHIQDRSRAASDTVFPIKGKARFETRLPRTACGLKGLITLRHDDRFRVTPATALARTFTNPHGLP